MKKWIGPIVLGIVLLSYVGRADVTNFIMFIGQFVLASTVGAPLSTDANGQLVSGITNYISSTSSATTCTTTDAAMSGITITPAAGTYLMLFSTDYNSANGGTILTVSFFQSTTQIAISQRKFMPFAGGTLTAGNQRIPFSVNSIQVLSGAAITVHCQTSASTATTADAELNLVRLQ